MNEQTQATHIHLPELPATGPLVRVTAGLGSAAQKTWNLRRPVTLIGSRRPAHIVLHDGEISHAHCVIINTGTEVLLKDLQTHAGTLCNDERCDLTVLKDGDVIAVGAGKIQVAIRASAEASADSGCGMVYRDPLTFPSPVTVRLVHTDQKWEIAEAAVLIGRHEAAPIFLDHADVARRHAVLFRFKDGPAIFDVSGQNGILINGQQCPLALLTNGDRVTVGPYGLLIGADDGAVLDVQHPAVAQTADQKAAPPGSVKPSKPAAPRGHPSNVGPGAIDAAPSDAEGVLAIDTSLDALRKGIASSWNHINSWQAQLLEDATDAGKRENNLTAKEIVLDARDAELRGRLHDVARFQDQLDERERELAAQRASFQAEKDKLAQDRAECDRREADVTRRGEELSRRDHVFAQRWARLVSAKCPHCGRPLGDGVNGPKSA